MARITGDNLDNILNGTPQADTILGLGGNDTLFGFGGNDSLDGGDGNDTVDGGAGSDSVEGGDGNDILVYRASENVGANDVYGGGKGTDTLRLVLTSAEAAAAAADLAAFQAFLAKNANPNAGTGPAFTFKSLGLTVRGVEQLQIVAANTAHTGTVVITGTATEDQILTANTSGIADADGLGTFAYQWQRNGVNILGATNSTYTLGDADVGATMKVVVSYTDGQGFAESSTSAATSAVSAANDLPAGTVVITGTATEDQILTANTSGIADADGLGTFAYQWQRNGVNILGATNSTYTLGDADVGATMKVVVSYTDGQGFAESSTSAATSAVSAVNDLPAGTVVITGTATEDQILTANTSGIADADGLGTFAYQWQRNGVNILGATNSTYTLGDADVGATMKVVVSYTDGQGFAESSTSAATSAVSAVNDLPAGTVVITGTATEDQILTANTSGIADADGLGTFAYQWQRNGVNILGATNSTYTLGDADVGATMKVVVSYTDGQGFAESSTSAATSAVSAVNDAPVAAPDSFTTGEDQTLNVAAPGLLLNDTDVDSATLTAALVSGPSHGTLILNANGSFNYTPNAIFHGSDSFTYRANDGALNSAPATVTITVKPAFLVAAFTDVDGDHQFYMQNGDLLIAGIIDTDNSSTVSVGDTVVLGDYSDLNGNQVGTFLNDDFVIDANDLIEVTATSVTITQVPTNVPNTATYRWTDFETATTAVESFATFTDTPPAGTETLISDSIIGAGADQVHAFEPAFGANPSVTFDQTGSSGNGDQGFIDVILQQRVIVPITAQDDVVGAIQEDTTFSGNVLANDSGNGTKVLQSVAYGGSTFNFSGSDPVVIALEGGAEATIHSNGDFNIDANGADSLTEGEEAQFDISYVARQTVDWESLTDEAHLTGTIVGVDNDAVAPAFLVAAFTDVDGDHQFYMQNGDLLIAGIIDTDNSSTVSVGDTVVLGDYSDLNGNQVGTFLNDDFVIDANDLIEVTATSVTITQVPTNVPNTATYRWTDFETATTAVESFATFTDTPPAGTETLISDSIIGAGADRVHAFEPAFGANPSVTFDQTGSSGNGDQGFIDVLFA